MRPSGVGPFLGLILALLACAGPADLGPPPPRDGQSLKDVVGYLADRHPRRLAGGASERSTALWFEARLKALGLSVRVDDFPVPAYGESSANLALVDGAVLSPKPLLFAPPTPGTGVEGPLLDAGWGLEADFAQAAGRILVIRRRSGGIRDLVETAAAAGALGVLILDPGRPTTQLFAGRSLDLPVAELGGREALDLSRRLAPGGPGSPAPGTSSEIRARLVLRSTTKPGTSRNIVGFIPGRGPAPGAAPLLVGAHLDSVDCPGAVDNASGLACLLSVAGTLQEDRLERDVYVLAFGAEEIGELGSERFLAEWRGPAFGGVLILDTVGSGSLTMVYSLRGQGNAVTRAAAEGAATLGLRAEGGGSENSDHLPFALNGMPAAFLMRLPEERRHTVYDLPEAIQPEALKETRDLALATLRELSAGTAGTGAPRP